MTSARQKVAVWIQRIAQPPYKLGTKELSAIEAAAFLLDDNILTVQEFCDDNSVLCSSQRLWRSLFENRFTNLYPLFLEVADALLGNGVEGVNPFEVVGCDVVGCESSYSPLFWRDSYTDLFNIPQDLLGVVEKLINGEDLLGAEKETLPGLYRDFWTVGVVLGNLDASSGIMVPSMLSNGVKLLPYIFFPEDAVTQREISGMLDDGKLGQEAMLFIMDKNIKYNKQKMLLLAVGSGYTDVASLLLKDSKTNDNLMIAYAVEKGHTNIVRIFLDDERFDMWHGRDNLIYIASTNGRTEVLDLLLRDGRADPTAEGNKSIIWASYFGHEGTVGLLLKDGRADPGVEDNTAIVLACKYGKTGILVLLLEDNRVNIPYSRCICPAARGGYADIVSILLEHSVGKPEGGETISLGIVSSTGKTSLVQVLVDDGRADPDPEGDGTTPITNASMNGHTQIVDILLRDSRVDPTRNESSALRMAYGNNHIDIVELLLRDGRSNPAFEDNQLIIWATENGHTNILKLLLKDDRADPAAQESKAIIAALTNARLGALKLLLNDGRAIPATKRNSSLALASRSGSVDAVKLMLADGRSSSVVGLTRALSATPKHGGLEIAKLLLAQWNTASRETYGLLKRVTLKELARDKGLGVNSALDKEELITKLHQGKEKKEGVLVTEEQEENISCEEQSEGSVVSGKKRDGPTQEDKLEVSVKKYDEMTLKALRAEAAKKKIRGRSKMNKETLVQVLKDE